jgi:hypothetical protein
MSARRRAQLALAAVTAASAIAAPPATAGSFQVNRCDFVKHEQIDPIVSYGGQSGHVHTFRGNQSINAWSTLATLRAGTTKCTRNVDTDKPGSGDLSSYWVPSLIELDPLTGNKIRDIPIVSTATYYFGVHRYPSQIQPYPKGLKILVGDVNATAEEAEVARRNGSVVWSCPGGSLSEPNQPSYCVDTNLTDNSTPRLRLDLRFPSCWDGFEPSDADAQPGRTNYDDSAHVALRVAVNGNNTSPWTCPASHPIPIPQLHIIWIWQTRGGPNVRMSLPNPYGAHGDFFNAWDEEVLRKLVVNCLQANVSCGSGDQPPPPTTTEPPSPPPLPLPPLG